MTAVAPLWAPVSPVHGFRVYSSWWSESIEVNALSMSAARSRIWHGAKEHWPTMPFAEVRARKFAGPVTTDMLRRVQEHRGRPDLVAGALVSIDGSRRGRVVGACGGACFNVLSADGQTWSVHPNDLTVVPDPMVLKCPKCKAPHLDTGDWATKPHKTHLCLECGHEWRPCDFPTVGVAVLP